MSFKARLLKLAYWTIPGGIYNGILKLRENRVKENEVRNDPLFELIQSNEIFRNAHKGKRCFILCNGPSINTQNLHLLEDEIVFSVSNGYRHPDYLAFQPAFHCVPSIVYSEKFTESIAVDWFREMDKGIGSATLFLSTNEYDLVQRYQLFQGRKVHYVYLGSPWENGRSSVYDICNKIPGVMSVSILCLMLSLYCGFDNVYLLGTEHDVLTKKKYNYFYDTSETIFSNKIENHSDQGELSFPLSVSLNILSELWKEYESLNTIAKRNNIHIFNATNGGDLDVFPRADLDFMFV